MSLTYQKKALRISQYHGTNVQRLNDFIASADYSRAHGQFIMNSDLRPGERFSLEFDGTGIIKVQGFPSKRQAEEWVRSKQPLGNGSIRIRTRKTLRYQVSVPPQGDSITLTTRKKQRQDHLEGKILAFDIEYGDLVVIALKEQNNNCVEFSDICHSRHIEIRNSPKLSHASLIHYNPTSLCTPENCTICPGDVFKLEVRGPENEKHTGSYVRVCVARKHSEYGNSGLNRCEGTRTVPEVKGDRLMIKPNKCEQFYIRVEDDRVLVERKGNAINCLEAPLSRNDLGIWFELHRVDMRLWKIRVLQTSDSPDVMVDTPPDYPAPPPPRQIQTRHNRAATSVGSDRPEGLVEMGSSFSDDSFSNHYISIQRDNEVSSYVSADSERADNFRRFSVSGIDEAYGTCSRPDSGETYKADSGDFARATECVLSPTDSAFPHTESVYSPMNSVFPQRESVLPPTESVFPHTVSVMPSLPPPVPPKPCSLRCKSIIHSRKNEVSNDLVVPIPTRQDQRREFHSNDMESMNRCHQWVEDQANSIQPGYLQEAPEHQFLTDNDASCLGSSDSSFFINYNNPDTLPYRHEINIAPSQGPAIPRRKSNTSLTYLPSSPESYNSLPSVCSFGLREEEHEANVKPPEPCGAAKYNRELSDDSISEFSEMSIDERTDVKIIRTKKDESTSSSADSKWHRTHTPPFFGTAFARRENTFRSSSSSESDMDDDVKYPVLFMDRNEENELSREDEVTKREKPIIERNIVESAIINSRMESSVACVEQGPKITLPNNIKIEFTRSSTIRRNLNTVSPTSERKRYNSK